MDGGSPRPADELYREVLALAEERLGPESARWVREEGVFMRILAHVRDGDAPIDALLREVHAGAREDRLLEDEFLRHLLPEFTRAASRAMRDRMRRLYDTDDLANSVLSSLWPRIYEIEFRTRAQFLAYLYNRLGWKVNDRDRGARAESRREDLRVPLPGDDIGEEDGSPSPAEMAARRERVRHAQAALARLQAQDREAVEAWAKDASWAEIAEALSTAEQEVTPEAARKRVARALGRLRTALAAGSPPPA